jgi:hypothetical protein
MRVAANSRSSRRLQQGWVGLIGLLIALLIVAWLSRTLIARLLPAPVTVHAGDSRVPGGQAPAPLDTNSASPNPRVELERAKGLQAEVQQQAADNEKRIEEHIEEPPKQ